MTNIIQNAVELAWKYHKDQTRKGDNSAYLPHPIMVATILAQNGFSDDVISSGFCHDLLEDTKCTDKEIKDACGEKVLEIVKAVTNDPHLEDKKDWEFKKEKYIETVRIGPVGAKAVCVADKIHNLTCLLEAYKEQGPSVWKKFNRGKDKKLWFEKKVLKMLKETWKHSLLKIYEELIKKEENLPE